MRNLKIKQLLPLFLASVIALTGCAGKQQTDGENSMGPAGNTEANQAMGRYVEDEITLPETLKQNLAFISHGRGDISFLAREPEQGSGYRMLCNGAFTEHAPDWLPDGNTGLAVTELIYGMDGGTYLLSADYTDENQIYHLYRLNPDKTRTELLSNILSERDEQLPEYPKMPDRVFILSDGRILLSDYSKAALYSADGSLQQTISQSAGVSNYRVPAAVTKEEYITISPDGEHLARFDLNTGKINAEISYNQGYNGAIATDEDGGVYVCDKRGIHYWAKGGTLWQTLVDGELNSLSMPSLSPMYLFLGEGDDFYTVAVDRQSNYYVYHYVYDEAIPAVPSKTLSIFGLNDKATVRQAISLFQKKNPDIRIDYRVALDGNEGGTLSDIMKALNTELLNGNGADVLLLDGLPVKSYIEKGILMDLSDIIQPLVAEGELLESMVSVYGDENGIYSVPIRFILPLVYGDEEVFSALHSLDALNARAEQGIMPVYRDGVLIRKLMTIFYNDIFQADGTLDYDEVEKLLMTAENLAAAGYYGGDTSDMRKELLDSMLEYSDGYGFSDIEFVPLDVDLTKIGITMADGIYSLFFPNEIINRKDLSTAALKGLFIPTQLAGINSSSRQAEAGKAFIMTLLSAEIQDTDLSDGLPVNEASLKKWMGEELDNYYLGMGHGDYGISAESPTADDLERIYGLAYDLTTPVLKEQVLWDMIEEEGAGYLNGSISLTEAMARIRSRSRLYFAE